MLLTFKEFRAYRHALPKTNSKTRDMYESYHIGYNARKKEEDVMRRPAIEKLNKERKVGDGTISARQTDKLFKYINLLEIRVFEKDPKLSFSDRLKQLFFRGYG